jgi:hypothetical protein
MGEISRGRESEGERGREREGEREKKKIKKYASIEISVRFN